ncbi:BMP family ABC transporter substrate-binding protein [Streptomyces sp. NPDC001070]
MVVLGIPGLVRTRFRPWMAVCAGVGAALLVGAVVWWWPSGEREEMPTARAYRDVDACLLTDGRGVVPGSQAAPVWAGMQDASARTRVRVSFLQVMGPDTEGNAVPYVNSLVEQQCSVVVGVGGAEVKAVRAVARKPRAAVRFVVVGDGPAGTGVALVPAGGAEQVREAVSRTLTELARSASRT